MMMTLGRVAACLLLLATVVVGRVSGASAADTPTAAAASAPAKIPAEICLTCHGMEGFAVPGADGKPRSLTVQPEKFHGSMHGKLDCVDCHTNITQAPHEPVQVKVDCVSCHENKWAAAEAAPKGAEPANKPTLHLVFQMIGKYMNSIHARPSRADQSHTNAACYDCHEPHAVYAPGTAEWLQWRMRLPEICGKCHTKELAAYSTSVHGRQVLHYENAKAPVCADCHTNHDIQNPQLASTRLVITQNCGGCHQTQLHTYLETYHGQVTSLGYGNTAKCFDCHGFHTIQKVDDPHSTVYPANRLNTCQKCHTNATPGFATFQPHGNPNDFKHYPVLWITQHFMTLLLIGVFTFFWTHSGLWFYRSWKERRQYGGHAPVYVRMEAAAVAPVVPEKRRFLQRFPAVWRVAHLCLLLSTMTLVLTGMTLFYSNSPWAPNVMHVLGGPVREGIIHRVAATIFISVFLVHGAMILVRLSRSRTFRWFGPDSLLPRWQDLWDIMAMYKWFLGVGRRPVFDRWTYWEKFDYWAVFWGMGVIGISGAMLWGKRYVAAVLPGYVFNIATIFHGEEAVLAAVFLFTVHFFNNHFRPDKFPLDTVMFTGVMSLEEFQREHTEEYERLVATGQLERRLVSGPSRSFALGSRMLGFTLIGIGLTLLLLVLTGFAFSMLRG